MEAEKRQDLLGLAGAQVLEDRVRLLGREAAPTELPYAEIATVESGVCLTLRTRDGRAFRLHTELSFFEKFRAALEEERGRAAAEAGGAGSGPSGGPGG